MRNKAHIFNPNDNLNMQDDFIFFDTETSVISKTDKEEIQILKLGWALYWNRLTDEKEYKYFKDSNIFWDFVENKTESINPIKNDMVNKRIMFVYAHNTEFDFKICNGYRELLINRGWKLHNIYIEQSIFMLVVKKEDMVLCIYDTLNYVHRPLKDIGKALGLDKMEIDFNKCSMEYLSEYCKNDVEITYRFLRKLIEFLTDNGLSRLKPTAASIAFNAFRHKFYSKENNPIYIHNIKPAIKLERDSYKGGITDCFKVGKFNENLVKLDINSMYPYIMKNTESPIRLSYFGKYTWDLSYLDFLLKNKHIIIKCEFVLPQKYAYILLKFKHDNLEKNGFLYGNLKGVLSTPEIEFVLKHGRIKYISEICIYDKSNIFNDFVDFFYRKRQEYIKDNNEIFSLICKMFLNSLYGKFGQRDTNYQMVEKQAITNEIKKYTIYDINGEYTLIHIGDKIFKLSESDENSYDSFVAISSLITAYARMYLIEMIMAIGRDNLYYCDTDCLIVKESAMPKLNAYINNTQLGKLKNEGITDYAEFYRPKFYLFKGELKCKGVKHDADKRKTLSDSSDEWIIEQDTFEKFKTSIKKGSIDCQRIVKTVKHMDKLYDKGHIIGKNILPFNSDEITLLN
jgi:hypothetical protein